MTEKCVFIGCSEDAVWKGSATQKDIDKIDNKDNRNKHLFKAGTGYYCEKDKLAIEGYCPHLKFEKL